MTTLRVLVHALDRTGPPMLARSLLRWVAAHRADVIVDLVAFRGGPMLNDFEELVPTAVVLDDGEPWDHGRPDTGRRDELRNRLSRLPPTDSTLLVSVAAGQCLDLLPRGTGTIVTWVVEQGEDLHWLDPPVDVAGRTDRWLAGSAGSARELDDRLPGVRDIQLAPEFIEPPVVDPDRARALRDQLAPGEGSLLVVGAGIGTWRKAPDLFLEVALAVRRSTGRPTVFAWIGGESDPLLPLLRRTATELGVDEHVRWVDSTPELDNYLAAADAMVHPARLDAFPLVCLQAAAVGTPVLSFDGGGLVEMFDTAFSGVGYPDVNGLALLLDSLVDSGALRATGVAQQRRVHEHFIAEAAAPKVLEAALTAASDIGERR